MNVAELIGRTRVALDHPLPNHPSDRQLRDIAFEEVQHYQNCIRMSQRRGETAEIEFQLEPDVPQTVIPVSDLGTWVYAYVCDPDRPWNEPPVLLIDAADFVGFITPFDVATSNIPCEVYGALLTRDEGTFFHRRTPVSQSLTVKLRYEVGPVTLYHTKAIPLPEHHDYLLTRCVIAAAAKAQWYEADKTRYGIDLAYSEWFDGNLRTRRKELAAPYMAKFSHLQALFEKDIRRPEEPRVLELSSGVDMEDIHFMGGGW